MCRASHETQKQSRSAEDRYCQYGLNRREIQGANSAPSKARSIRPQPRRRKALGARIISGAYIYILRCARGTYHTGITHYFVDERVSEHARAQLPLPIGPSFNTVEQGF
ncbi:MAG: hypothetical protein ACLPTZ_23865 [Beijerinckiaceae bacterium]